MENVATNLYFPISLSDILSSQFFENDVKHIWLYTALKMDGENEII
jgi:hypothetical protein